MHPIMVLAFVLLAAVALAPISYLASTPEVLPVNAGTVDAESVDAGPVHWGAVATPNHDPYHARPVQPQTAESVATPNQDALPVRPMPSFAMNPAEPVATPNHDAHRLRPMPSFALNPSFALPPGSLRAEPEAAAPPTPVFVGTDTVLYARDSARLRAAPSTAGDVVAKLAADTPLRAVARSTDRAWWRVSLIDGRTGYVHRTAVTQYRMVKTAPLAEPAPIAVVSSPQPVSTGRRQGLLGYVDETMNWLADTASRGSAPTVARTER